MAFTSSSNGGVNVVKVVGTKQEWDASVLLRASSSSSTSSSFSSDYFTSALAIVPPTNDWDRIQRARHFAKDPLFHVWPPAIRLFHPFVMRTDSAVALDVAQIVEDLELEPFEITFNNQWVIVPHIESMQMEWEKIQANPNVIMGIEKSSTELKAAREMEEIQQLIQSEAEKSKQRKSKRHLQRQQLPQNDKETLDQSEESGIIKKLIKRRYKKSPAEIVEQQRKMLDDDGGSCILCLEPDDESKQTIQELREAIQEALDHDPYSSPSSLYSWRVVKDIDMGYRPLIPISKFESFQTAMNVARRLKGLWGEPLTFMVKDLHILSCCQDGEEDTTNSSWNSQADKNIGESRHTDLEFKDQKWSCVAKIMLLGEEMKQDEEKNQQMVDNLVEKGEPGGMDISFDFTILEDEEESTADIEKWLDDDDEYDEGSQVIIGRTHFFTGEQRIYKGMPASSTMDAKDKSTGEPGNVSGASRRKGSTSRQWKDNEYGRHIKDVLSKKMKGRGTFDERLSK